jgi:hypothetical protein
VDPHNDPRWRKKSLEVCPRKRSYPTRAAAQRAVRRAEYDGWDHMEPYRCRGCGKYHVGHPPEV